jgi:hypothetical protein
MAVDVDRLGDLADGCRNTTTSKNFSTRIGDKAQADGKDSRSKMVQVKLPSVWPSDSAVFSWIPREICADLARRICFGCLGAGHDQMKDAFVDGPQKFLQVAALRN